MVEGLALCHGTVLERVFLVLDRGGPVVNVLVVHPCLVAVKYFT